MPFFPTLLMFVISVGIACLAATALLTGWNSLDRSCNSTTPNRYAVLALALVILAVAAILTQVQA